MYAQALYDIYPPNETTCIDDVGHDNRIALRLTKAITLWLTGDARRSSWGAGVTFIYELPWIASSYIRSKMAKQVKRVFRRLIVPALTQAGWRVNKEEYYGSDTPSDTRRTIFETRIDSWPRTISIITVARCPLPSTAALLRVHRPLLSRDLVEVIIAAASSSHFPLSTDILATLLKEKRRRYYVRSKYNEYDNDDAIVQGVLNAVALQTEKSAYFNGYGIHASATYEIDSEDVVGTTEQQHQQIMRVFREQVKSVLEAAGWGVEGKLSYEDERYWTNDNDEYHGTVLLISLYAKKIDDDKEPLQPVMKVSNQST